VATAAEGPRTVLLDVSNPIDPQPIGGGDFLARDEEGEPREAYFTNLVNGFVWYARKSSGAGLMIYDVRDPARPTFVGAVRSEGGGGYVFVKDDHAFEGAGSIGYAYDVSDPSSPTEIATFELTGDLDTVTPIGNFVVASVDAEAAPNRGSAVIPFETARDGYIACAHCHLDGDSDHHVWDFTARGEGLRRTPPLFARVDHGPLHWSANFDEVQDFENDIRAHQGGRGLLSDADFAATSDTLGASKAGRSEELDALAAYVASLREPPSPHRRVDDSLPELARTGRDVFASAGCGSCHAGAVLTDSALVDGAPVLHDVGTLSGASGSRLGAPLTGLDTPTLHGLWHQTRFLHDGRATTIEEAIRAHDESAVDPDALDEAAMTALVAYLRCLDGRVD